MIYLLLAEGFEEIEALCPLDMLRRAGAEVQTVGVTGTCVTGAHGITVKADLLPNEASKTPTLLILPGGLPGTTNLDKAEITDTLIERTISCGGHLAAICAAPSVLGKRGLLRGRRATCYPGFESTLEGAILSDASVVTDGNVTTAVGMGAAYAFGHELVSIVKDRATADKIAASAKIVL